jgi:hypothetical protein
MQKLAYARQWSFGIHIALFFLHHHIHIR